MSAHPMHNLMHTSNTNSMYQPPNSEDMRRTPPTNRGCARVRAKLRDYADGDLTVVDVASVDEHLQDCRVCAVELARAEHEVLRLRRAFEEIQAEQDADPRLDLRSDFAARVVEQLVLTDMVDSVVTDRDAPSSKAASNAAAVVAVASSENSGQESLSAGTTVRRDRELVLASPAGMLVAGLLGLFVLVIGTRLLDWSVGQPVPFVGLVMVSGEGFGTNRHPLSGGDLIGEAEGVWVRRGGSATTEWHDLSERQQPAATIKLQTGEMQLKGGAPMLVDGTLLLQTNRSVTVPLIDGSRLSLGVGDYLLTAIPADLDDPGAFSPVGTVPWGEGARIQVEVLNGEDAKILRNGPKSGVVAVGQVGSYQGSGPIDIYSLPPTAGGSLGDRPRVLLPPQILASLGGHVMGPNGQPIVGASIAATYIADEQKFDVSQIAGTGANGAFSLPTQRSVDKAYGWASAAPSLQRPDLGLVAPDAVSFVIQGDVATLDRPLSVGYAATVHGVILNDQGEPQFGVKVIPLIVDELFATVFALPPFTHRMSGEDGRFQISQLPSYLPRHQRLALLLTDELLETVVVPVPVRGSALTSFEETTHVMRPLRSVGMYGLPSNATVNILEEIPGLPGGAAVVSRAVQTNPAGYVSGVLVGRGRIWMHSGGPTPRLKELLEPSVGAAVLHPVGEFVSYAEHLRPLQPLADTRVKLQSTIRHQQIQIEDVPNIVQSQTMRVTDVANNNVPYAQVFAVSKTALAGSPSTRFLGFTGENGVISIGAVAATEDVFVIGPNGGLAWIARPTATGNVAQTVELQLQATGRVLLGETLRPAAANPNRFVKVTFRRDPGEVLDGMTPVAIRFATDGYWQMDDLPPGQYRAEVLGQEFSVVVPSSGFVTLEAQ
tara:strand:+ start:24 stop:2684 length:2661 start_codon:yes stop_codon:yes gene_type:complete